MARDSLMDGLMDGQGAQEDPEERLGGPGRGKRTIQIVLRCPGRLFCTSNPSIPDRGALEHFCCETRYHTKAPSDANFLRGFAHPDQSILDRDALGHFGCETRYHTKALSDANFLGGFTSSTQASLIGLHLTIFAARPLIERNAISKHSY